MSALTIAQLFDLTGQSALVTGGGMGIGQAVALRLAEAGAKVMITDIDLPAAKETVKQIKAKKGKAQAIRADVRVLADQKKAVAATVDAFGSIDILVNNAGIYPLASFLEVDEKMWDNVHTTDLKGLFFQSQAAAKQMIKAGRGGKIVNLASVSSLAPNWYLSHYNAAKGGVLMATKILALELAKHNIRVNAVAPGHIKTPGSKRVAMERASALGLDPKEVTARMAGASPLGRMGEPDDVARVVLFLASEASDYLTGSIIVADGGRLLAQSHIRSSR